MSKQLKKHTQMQENIYRYIFFEIIWINHRFIKNWKNITYKSEIQKHIQTDILNDRYEKGSIEILYMWSINSNSPEFQADN